MIDDIVAAMRHLRHQLHADPELAFEEHRTSDRIAGQLEALGIAVHRGIGGTGLVGVIDHGRPGPSVGLRSEMDALPIREIEGRAHGSRNQAVMHACGHDGHMAMLVGAAALLARQTEMKGRVVLIFQPAEEQGGGADRMIADGLFERFPIDCIFSIHNWPELPEGVAAVAPGPMMAAADRFDVRFVGTGGHAAMPHLAKDPVPALAGFIAHVQTIVSRERDPTEPGAVVSITTVRAGEAQNAIAGEALVGGSVRSFAPAVRDSVEASLARGARGIAAAAGLDCEFRYSRGYPATVNDPQMAGLAATAARVVGRIREVREDLPPSMAAEDFAFMLALRPGAYIWLGQGGGPSSCTVHNPGYDFNDSILETGILLWMSIIDEVSRSWMGHMQG